MNQSKSAWLTACERLAQQASSNQHRQLVWLSGEADWCYQQAHSLTLAQPVARECWVTQVQPLDPAIETCSALQAQRWLGSECQRLVFDGYSGVNPDALGQVAGTLCAGGLLIFITPSASRWPQFVDPEFERLYTQPYRPEQVGRQFLTWLLQQLRNCSGVMQFDQFEGLTQPELTDVSTQSLEQRLAEQTRWLELHLQKRDSTAFISVVTAARGRGKSTALGLLAARWQGPVLLTGASPAAVKPLQQHCELSYQPPGELLALSPAQASGALLLIDEAAALSVDRLLALCRHFPRVILATTTEGYEGTGQGFRQRLLPALELQGFKLEQYSFTQPIRWAANDPLEMWLNQLLLLDFPALQAAEGELTIEQVSPDALLQRPALLRQAFSLLVQAHHRTTPGDLRILLDSPNMRLWLATQGGCVVGAVLVAEEGAIDDCQDAASGAELALHMWQGRRRPRGHLIPQILISQQGHLAARGERYWRVVRIATVADKRRQGIASAMLAQVRQQALSQRLDGWGASFAASEALLSFWCSQGLSLVRLGSQLDPLSGSYSALVLECFGQTCDYAAQFARRWPFTREVLLERPLASWIGQIDRLLPAPAGDNPAVTLAELNCFVEHQSGLERVGFLLAERLAASQAADWPINYRQWQLLEALFCSGLPLQQQSQQLGFVSHKQLLSQLRPLLGKLIPYWYR